ncbi:MAG: signal peptidase II, partial [Planctomycetia bacterium]
MRRRLSAPFSLFFTVAAVGFLADVGSKYAVSQWVEASGGEVVLIPDWLSFIDRLNQGAMWSLGHQWEGGANFLLATFSSVVALGISVYACFVLEPGRRWLAVALGCILGGALGNLYDRIMFQGVRDFIDVHYKNVYHYPT